MAEHVQSIVVSFVESGEARKGSKFKKLCRELCRKLCRVGRGDQGFRNLCRTVIIPVFLISNSTLLWTRQTAHVAWFFIWNSGKQEGTAVSWNRGADCCNLEFLFEIIMNARPAPHGATTNFACAAWRARRPWRRSTNPATTGCPAARRACAPSHRLRSGLCWNRDKARVRKLTHSRTPTLPHPHTRTHTSRGIDKDYDKDYDKEKLTQLRTGNRSSC